MSTIIPFCTLDAPCPYLKAHLSRMEFYYIEDCDFDENYNLISHGYRRFGRYFSKPICKNCSKCKSMRIDAENFKFTKSFRRVLKKNENTKMIFSQPVVDMEHINLYKKYHNYMNQKRDWKIYDINLMQYFNLYVAGSGEFGREISYYDINGQLICVDLIDITKDGISSIYCYYDPKFSALSLGKFSLLMQIKIALEKDLRWIYLGFYVKECQSLAYKSEYRPFQTLKSYCELEKDEIWEFLPDNF